MKRTIRNRPAEQEEVEEYEEEEEMEEAEELPAKSSPTRPVKPAKKKLSEATVEATEIVKEVELGYTLPDGKTTTKDGLMLWMAQQIWEIKKAVA